MDPTQRPIIQYSAGYGVMVHRAHLGIFWQANGGTNQIDESLFLLILVCLEVVENRRTEHKPSLLGILVELATLLQIADSCRHGSE